MEVRPVKTFYRVTKTNPPTERDYVTLAERKGDPPETLTEEARASWYAFSAYDTIDGARNQALQVRGIGRFIWRYDIPEDAGIRWAQTLFPGHYDLWGDKDVLRACEVGYVADV